MLVLVSKLQTIVMEGITHPGRAQPVGRQALVILQPDFFILERIYLAKFAGQVQASG